MCNFHDSKHIPSGNIGSKESWSQNIDLLVLMLTFPCEANAMYIRWDAVQRKLAKEDRRAPPNPPENTELVLSGRVKRAVLEEYNQANQNYISLMIIWRAF